MKSMTGFGSGRSESAAGTVTVELRSVNSRFLEIGLRLPGEWSAEEPLVRGDLQKALQRGKVAMQLQFTPAPGGGQQAVINETLLAQLESLVKSRGQEPSIQGLLTLPGVVELRQPEGQQEALRNQLREALRGAIQGLLAERGREGAVLADALRELRAKMREHLDFIEQARHAVVEKYRDKLFQRIEELVGPRGVTLDAGRLEQEVALFADKADLSEEVTRLAAHLDHLGTILDSKEDNGVGRQLEFLNQEILREINTIGSKCRDLDIARRVLDLKNLAESLREQVANIE
ncbi:YicC family protein [bacterium]|nr:YicC family protein [bacterium]